MERNRREKPAVRPYRYEGSLYSGRISATNRETLVRFSPQTTKRWPGFAPNHEAKKLYIEIALKQGRGKHTLEPKKNWASEQRKCTMIGRHWLDYDHVALAVLIIGLGIVELVAFGI